MSHSAYTAMDNKPLVFFNAAHRAFKKAEENARHSIDRFFSIGGYTIRLHFAGSALVPLVTPALEHLASQECTSPSLTVFVWDSESTQSFMPTPPWSLNDYSARGEVRSYSDDRFLTACHKGSGALSMLDGNRDVALWWIRSAAKVPFYESGSPLLTILHWWMRQHGLQVVHAGAVGTPEAGVLLAGRGGCGKSTTALACLNSELLYAGDDYCLVTPFPVPYVYSLYSSAKLDPDHIRRLPHLLPAISNTDRLNTEKALLFLNQYSFKMSNGFRIRAIFLPRVTGLSNTRLTPTSSLGGLKALAPSTLFQLSCANHKALHEMAKFSKQVPCYYLDLGTELHQVADVIFDFLSKS